MRGYAKLAPQFWIGDTGRAIRGQIEAQIVAVYLLSSPHANMLGLYYLPICYISHDTGLTTEGASKGLRRCLEEGFCAYDEGNEFVWVFKMAEYQVAPSLLAKDNRVKGVQEEYDKLPQNIFLGDFFDQYQEAFRMKNRRGFEGASKGLRSQEQEQEQEQDYYLTHGEPNKGTRTEGNDWAPPIQTEAVKQ